MDLLAINVGNTGITGGVFAGRRLLKTVRFRCSEAAEAAVALLELAKGRKAALCTVADGAGGVIEDAFAGRTLQKILPDKQKLISGLYQGFGVDRLANAAAGFKLLSRDCPVLVVDFGTATTLTVVDERGKLLGGLITLGLSRSLETLQKSFPALPEFSLEGPLANAQALETSTIGAMKSGVILGQVGIAELWVRKVKEVYPTAKAAATGGWSQEMAALTQVFDLVDPHLTLRGIYFMAEAAAHQAGPD